MTVHMYINFLIELLHVLEMICVYKLVLISHILIVNENALYVDASYMYTCKLA